jgi:hypothetical protein
MFGLSQIQRKKSHAFPSLYRNVPEITSVEMNVCYTSIFALGTASARTIRYQSVERYHVRAHAGARVTRLHAGPSTPARRHPSSCVKQLQHTFEIAETLATYV